VLRNRQRERKKTEREKEDRERQGRQRYGEKKDRNSKESDKRVRNQVWESERETSYGNRDIVWNREQK
jgi:hypothetical protein